MELEGLALVTTRNCNGVMYYIQGNIGLPLILSINKPGNIKWYVDAAFSVHKT